jgi:predicted heme/steroid binding protein
MLNSGTDASRPTYVAIKGIVFDVTRNSAYGPEGQYRGTYQSSSNAK